MTFSRYPLLLRIHTAKDFDYIFSIWSLASQHGSSTIMYLYSISLGPGLAALYHNIIGWARSWDGVYVLPGRPRLLVMAQAAEQVAEKVGRSGFVHMGATFSQERQRLEGGERQWMKRHMHAACEGALSGEWCTQPRTIFGENGHVNKF